MVMARRLISGGRAYVGSWHFSDLVPAPYDGCFPSGSGSRSTGLLCWMLCAGQESLLGGTGQSCDCATPFMVSRVSRRFSNCFAAVFNLSCGVSIRRALAARTHGRLSATFCLPTSDVGPVLNPPCQRQRFRPSSTTATHGRPFCVIAPHSARRALVLRPRTRPVMGSTGGLNAMCIPNF